MSPPCIVDIRPRSRAPNIPCTGWDGILCSLILCLFLSTTGKTWQQRHILRRNILNSKHTKAHLSSRARELLYSVQIKVFHTGNGVRGFMNSLSIVSSEGGLLNRRQAVLKEGWTVSERAALWVHRVRQISCCELPHLPPRLSPMLSSLLSQRSAYLMARAP